MKVTRLRILSYNIHKGITFTTRRSVIHLIKEGIRSTKADLVFLQEVVGEKKSSNGEPPLQAQFEFLSDAVWPHYAYGRNAVYSSGHHGNAILSAYPLKQWGNLNISTNPFEKRGMLHAEIKIPEVEHKLDCFCVHLSLFQKGRDKQLARICSQILEHTQNNTPFILAGDFNDWGHLATPKISSMLNATEVFANFSGNYARTFPAFLPLLRLDRIYISGLKVTNAQVLHGHPWNKLSDHLALYAELEIEV